MDLYKDLETITKWFKALEPIGEDNTGGVTRLGYTKTEDVMHGAIRNILYFCAVLYKIIA